MTDASLVERIAALEVQVAAIRDDVRELESAKTLGTTATRALAEDLRADLRKIHFTLQNLHREFRAVQDVQRRNAPTIDRMRALNRAVAAVIAAVGSALFLFAADLRDALARIWATFRN